MFRFDVLVTLRVKQTVFKTDNGSYFEVSITLSARKTDYYIYDFHQLVIILFIYLFYIYHFIYNLFEIKIVNITQLLYNISKQGEACYMLHCDISNVK